MAACRWITKVERWFDGERGVDTAVNDHLSTCGACRDHVKHLEALRAEFAAGARRHEIQDAQLPAFMAGIREGVHADRSGYRGLWAYLSLVAAALIVAVSAFVMFPRESDEVVATVDSAVTELEGGEVHVDVTGNTTTIWVEVDEHRDIQ